MSARPTAIDPADFDPTTPASADFYRHVNGGWLDAHPVPPEYPAWGTFLEIHVRNEDLLHQILIDSAADPGPTGSASQKVGDYFASGMDEEAIADNGVEPLRPLLDAIDAISDLAGLRACVHDLKAVGVGVFHGIGVAPDFEDADRYLVYLGQGGLGLPEKSYYEKDDDRSTQLLEAYEAHVATQLAHLGIDGEDAAGAVVAFEKRLASPSYPPEKLRDVSLTLNRHSTEELDELMPSFGLKTYIRDFGVTAESLSIDNPGFFAELDEVIANTPLETIRSYLRWHLIKSFASALPPQFEDASFDFYGRILGGQKEQRPRWTRVLQAASTDIGELVGRLYVESAFSPEAKARCEEMVDRLIEAMKRSIGELDWMTAGTKEAALTKVAAFTHKIGYPDEWRDYTDLLIERDSYVGNRMRCVTFEMNRRLRRLGEPVDRSEWELPPHSVNAYYNPLLNEIVFPAGILQPPMFYADADDAVNYGGIGTVIGHEITHGFDDNGGRFDEKGARRNWWTDSDRTEFQRRAQVLVDQFSKYEVAADQNVNGQLTLGENIADLGGLTISYDAFTRQAEGTDIGGFTPAQRFFLAYAIIWRMNYTEEYVRLLTNVDVHAPNQFRVNGPLSNLPAFAEAFDIQEGAAMARSAADRAKVW